MKTIETQVFEYDELDEKAKEKARDWYKDNDDMPFLSEFIDEKAHELLTAAGFTVHELRMFYSLSYSQGDGASFDATLERDGHTYTTRVRGPIYVHEYMMQFSQDDDEDVPDAIKNELRGIAKDIARAGYKYIAAERDNENVAEAIRANEYTFTASGKRFG